MGAVMESFQIQNASWDRLSSVFSNLDLSMSQDSSYGSDVQSSSTEHTSVTTSPVMSSVPSAKVSVTRPLKSILKKPEEAHGNDDGDSDSESGYESEPSEYDFDHSLDSDPSDLHYCEGKFPKLRRFNMHLTSNRRNFRLRGRLG